MAFLMRNYRSHLLVLAMIFSLGSSACAQDADHNVSGGHGWLDNSAEGFFWHKEPPAPEPTPVVTPVPTTADSAAKPAEPAPLSAEWFAKNLDHYRDAAVDDPTPEKVVAYLTLQRIMMDKASAFTDATQAAVAMNPFLDANNERALGDAPADAANEVAGAARSRVLTKLSGMSGILFFFNSRCGLCEQEANILDELKAEYGFNVLAVSLDGKAIVGGAQRSFVADQGQAAKLGVTALPSIYLLRPPDLSLPIAQNVMTVDDTADRILIQAHTHGWITDAEWEETRPDHIRSLVALSKSITPEMLESPTDLVSYIKSSLGVAP
jgi:conjugal transfer pilus assembly protein TraF